MSTNDRFKSKPATLSAKSLDSLGKDAESADNVVATRKRVNVFLPPIDYSSASNFAVYGSAEKYYEDAVKRVYLEYPYDGSEKEINEYTLSSSFLDQYVLNKRYPRTCGQAVFAGKQWGTLVSTSGEYGAPATGSYEYISFFGGPNTNLSTSDSIHDAFSGSHNQNNIYDLSKKRGSNLALNPTSGSTVEFWLRKEAFDPSKTKKEVILDVWNGEATYTDATYGRFMVEISGSGHGAAGQNVFRLTYLSGTVGMTNQSIGLSTVTTASVANNLWNHYAITLASSSDSGFNGKLYINGELNDSKFFSNVGTLQEIRGPLRGNLGALAYTPPGSNDAPVKGWGKMSASLDEFRYWKIERSSEDIGRNWFTQVRGGTNTDDANVDLGVYFKFNEGITGNTGIDTTVLDYSGRISNGTWTGYNAFSRNTGSAIESSFAAPTEFRDPIVHPSHPDVSRVLGILKDQGKSYDQQNNSSIFNSLPAWIIETDSSGHLKNLVQIVASYFDKLQNQIREVPRLKNLTYLSSSYNSPSFSSDLVNSTGMFASEMFIDSNIMEQILSRDEDRNFDLDLDEIRNRIYQNIYNNLVHINKAKGTEKAFRNLIHCYGIDEQLIRFNTYGDEVTYELKDNFRSTVVAKNLVDFSDETRNDATIYQMTASSNTNSVSFISGSASGSLKPIGDQVEDYLGFTLEGEVIFPVTPDVCESTASIGNPIVSSSVFGMHGARGGTPADTTWPDTDYADIRLLAVRSGNDFNSEDAKFLLTSSIGGLPTLTSDIYKDVYDNKKWNFAVRVINDKYPLGDVITGVSSSSESYRLEFYGINQTLDVTENEFFLTGAISSQDAKRLLRSDKRIFAGAHRTNFSGSVLQLSDIKLSNVKYWSSYIDNKTIKAHARDTENYGTKFPHRNAFLTQKAATGSYIPQIETLALNWNFYNITGSNEAGMFTVDDSSSGSVELQKRYGWLGNIVKAQHTGLGYAFPENDKKAINKDFIYVARQTQPESVHSSEMINILSRDDEYFTRDQRPIRYYFSIEKSMYQVISDEMLNTFATMVEFNNLIGDPVNRYRQDYKLLEKARALYFESIENDPDLDKFVEFYKWIDSSLSNFLQQLVPASANSSDEIRTLVESHVLERNKYWSKFPTLEKKTPGGAGGLLAAGSTSGGGTSESPYRSRDGSNFRLDSAPIPYVESEHAPYWKKKASRLEAPLATGITGVDNDRQSILEVLKTGYERDAKRPFVLTKKFHRSIHGGTNFPKNREKEIIINSTLPNGPRAGSGTPLNIVLIDDEELFDFQNINDVTDPNGKKFYSFNCRIRREDETGLLNVNNSTYTSTIKGHIAAPFRLVSGSVESGYNLLLKDGFKSGTILTNLHEDTFVNNERPMQGPFADAHVGGHQSRHVDINRFDSSKTTRNQIDSYQTRPEAFKLLLGIEYGTDTNMIGIVGPDYPYPVGPYPHTEFKMATRYRNVGAKRPVNIRNIQYNTSSVVLGNYTRDYEIVQTSGRSINNRHFVDNEGTPLPPHYVGTTTTVNSYLNQKQIHCISGTIGALGCPGYRIVTNSSLNDPTAFAFSMWLSCSDASAQSTTRFLISIGSDGASGERSLHIDTSNKVVFRAGYTSRDGVWTSDNVIWSTDGWHHVALTYNDGDGDANLYINGSETSGEFTTTPLGTFETPSSDSTLVCRRNNSSGQVVNNTSFYSGSIAEASYWNKKLSTSEVSEIYERGTTGDLPGPQNLSEHSAVSNLVSWWRFGDDTTDTEVLIKDQISSNNAASVANLPDNGMELVDLTAADLLIAGGGTATSTTTGYFPETTNVNSLLGINPQYTSAGNYFGRRQDSIGELSNRFSGSTNYTVRNRNSNKFVFAERFSAPGGPEINSDGFLDIAAEEKSVYNALPFRNLSVRGSGSGEIETMRANNLGRRAGLRTLLSQHAEQFGGPLGSSTPSATYRTDASWHKVNRNPRNRIQFNAATTYVDNNYVTGAVYDNAFITHPIPRSDYQYTWITASADEGRGRSGLPRGLVPRNFYGHVYGDSELSSSHKGFHQAISFVSESDVSAAPEGGALPNIHVDFVGLNTLVFEQIDLDNNIASGSEKAFAGTANYVNEFFQVKNIQSGILSASMLNALTLHRGGVYGFNTWKQTRAGQHAVARKMREANIISYFRKADNLDYPLKNDRLTPQPLRGMVSNFTEMPFENKYNPITQNLSIRGTTTDNRQITRKATIKTSYGNALTYFSNEELNNLLAEQINQSSVPAYDRIKDLYARDQVNNPDSPVEKFNSLTYRERVYPSSVNAFSSSIRIRQHYTNTFWRDLRSERERANVSSFGNTIALQSMWSLDADSDFETMSPRTRVGSTGGPGVLMNRYNQMHMGTLSNIKPGPQYVRIHTLENQLAAVAPEGLDIPELSPTANGGSRTHAAFKRFWRQDPESDRFGGQAKWDCGDQAGKNPWYNSYDDYVNEMRLKGKEYSIVPEFRISDHIEVYYKANNSDFLADRLDLFKIEGGESNKDDSSKTDFFRTYTNSDFLRYFGLVRDDIKEVGQPSSLKLTCGGLLKFLPYDGFYPVERTVEMAQMFSASYGNYVVLERGTGISKEAAFRTFMAPMFAPGVMYNTIKSGIAVDYPVMTSSFQKHSGEFLTTTSVAVPKSGDMVPNLYISGSNGIAQFGHRVPFEALLEPESYIADVDFVDMETHPSASLDVTASWGGQGGNLYKLMASNFLAESIDFFLPESTLTTITSKPEDQWEAAEDRKVYGARIKMRKTYNVPITRTGSLGYFNPLTPYDLWRQKSGDPARESFTMYSRPTAFGPPVGGGTTGSLIFASAGGFNPCFTPPYYYGESWADIFWTSSKAGTITADDITDPSNLAISYIRIGNDWALNDGQSQNTMLHSANIETNSMQLDAALNILSKATTKKITYDADTGKPIIAEDGGETVLTVQTKFETPMLNFADVSPTIPAQASSSVARGMWHQYGQPPASPDIGVFLSITDVPDNYIKNALGGNPAVTGSLIDLLGFKTEEQRLGEVAQSKLISEAVVAVPYIEAEGQKSFFEIPKADIDAALLDSPEASDSIKHMVNSIQKYVLPPKFDFIEYPDVITPFAMYIFEFEHMLDRDDLVDIWQGLPPKIGQSFDSESIDFKSGKGPHSSKIIKEVEISHPLLVGELLNKDNLPSKLRWMVFKIKRKAQKNYFDKVIKDNPSDGGIFDSSDITKVGRTNSSKTSIPRYSYNWPYDFFSLVELVKLDAEVEFTGDIQGEEE